VLISFVNYKSQVNFEVFFLLLLFLHDTLFNLLCYLFHPQGVWVLVAVFLAAEPLAYHERALLFKERLVAWLKLARFHVNCVELRKTVLRAESL